MVIVYIGLRMESLELSASWLLSQALISYMVLGKVFEVLVPLSPYL